MGSAICGQKEKTQISLPMVLSYSENPLEISEFLFHDPSKGIDNSTILELFIKCSGLPTENRFQLLNPIAHICVKEGKDFTVKFQTEVVSSTLNPIFNKTIKAIFSLKNHTDIKIDIFDVIATKAQKKYIGSNVFSIHELAASPDFITKELLFQGKRHGLISVAAKEIKDLNSILTMKWKFTSNNHTEDYLYLRLLRTTETGSTAIYQSETKQAPYLWESFNVSVNRLCRGNDTRTIIAEVITFGSDVKIGSSRFTLSLLSSPELELEVKSENSTLGVLSLVEFSYIQNSTFLDYIHSGIEIYPIYTIDFSVKQGHSIENIESNPYLQSIKELHSILQKYSADQPFPVFGTGALFKTWQSASNNFALTGNFFQPEIPTFSILQECYKVTMQNITHSTVTAFAEVIENCIKFVGFEYEESQKYFVLYILTTSDPRDLDEIIKKYQKISELPLSIFFIRMSGGLIKEHEKLKQTGGRAFIDVFIRDDIYCSLETLEKQMMQFASVKKLRIYKKIENIKSLRSFTSKTSSDKVRQRSNYFISTKSNYIDFLINIGYDTTKIEEVAEIGVPFLIMNANPSSELPIRNRSKTIRQKNSKVSELLCFNCGKIVYSFEASPCGCKYFCSECVKICACPDCSDKFNT